MRRIGDLYVGVGLVWLLLGMAFGIWMGMTQSLNYANSHAHLNLVGFVASVLFGLVFRQYPGMAHPLLAPVQFTIYQAGVVLLVAGKAIVDGGGGDMLVRIGSIVIFAGALLMLWLFVARRQADA